MRDGFIFYRSFYDAIKDLPRDIQGEIYTAIMEYSLNGKETENLNPIARSLFALMKPQIDANNKRFENGRKGGRPKSDNKPNINQVITKTKPSNNQNKTKVKPKDKDNDNDNDNDIKKESSNEDKKEAEASSCDSTNPDFLKFNDWIKRKAPYCSNIKNFPSQISEQEFMKLKEKYTGKQIAETIEQIENRKDLRKRYTNLYRTVLNWAKNEYGG
jgi:hypothetical protein